MYRVWPFQKQCSLLNIETCDFCHPKKKKDDSISNHYRTFNYVFSTSYTFIVSIPPLILPYRERLKLGSFSRVWNPSSHTNVSYKILPLFFSPPSFLPLFPPTKISFITKFTKTTTKETNKPPTESKGKISWLLFLL